MESVCSMFYCVCGLKIQELSWAAHTLATPLISTCIPFVENADVLYESDVIEINFGSN